MEPLTSSEEVLVCQTCGDQGFANAFVYCIKCLGYVIHRYCLDVIPRSPDDLVSWFCEDCKPAVSYPFTLPKLESSGSSKEAVPSSVHVETAHPKKKQKKQKKKRKITSLAVGKDNVNCPEEITEPDLECVSPTNSPPNEASVKSDSGQNQITPCVVAPLKDCICQKQASEYPCLDRNCYPVAGCKKRKSKATCSKTMETVEHSCCTSSCATVTLKNNEKLVFNSSSIEKKSNKETKDSGCQAETATYMHNEQDFIVDQARADVSKSADFEKNGQLFNYEVGLPIVDPVWRGSFNVTQTDYDLFEGFVAHLSSRACPKVCDEAAMLPSLLCLEMHAKTALWPKSFLEVEPTDEHIALYFFPGDTKNERAFDHLVMDMMEEGLAMRAEAKNADLLIFTSTVLPQSFWRFHNKYYLWGVFRVKQKDFQHR